MKREFTCIVCPNGCRLHTEVENGAVTSVTGNRCPKGRDFAEKECTAPHAKFVHHGKNAGGRRTGIAGAHSGRIAQGTPV